MSKLFQIHDRSGDRFNNRPYYRGTWETMRMEKDRLLPFQVKTDGDPLEVFQVVNGSETDITGRFNGLTDTHSDYTSYLGGKFSDYITEGRCYFKINAKYTEDADIMDVSASTDYITTAFSSKYVKLLISSTVDFGDTYYKGGFTQMMWKEAAIEKGQGAEVEIIGDERNGIIIKEKITTGTKYRVRLKVTESEFTALVEAIPANWTITDTNGKIYTCYNKELSDPDWYNGNGITTLTFTDNISTFAYNNDNL